MRSTKREVFHKRAGCVIESEQVRYGYTQDEISAKLGITRKTYRNWLDGGNIPVKKLIELSELFDCSIDYLLGRSDTRKFAVISLTTAPVEQRKVD